MHSAPWASLWFAVFDKGSGYCAYLDKPEDFVKIAKTFKLPEGIKPVDWARPGVDPLEKIAVFSKEN